ncbi:hypothetical protein ACNFU2_21215 [Chryseobacterium sp. PTM-20240506]|uniref:hypothetical protein n=1 Tax=unclassified Chryseobacterium TaxID=2593645 RepID=UPI0015527AAB|nr:MULTISPECIES: hypothetical protein [unclassified Chryseobacterium]MDC8103112.1 hypothetical protein [Chryseobacterium sp. B21-037]MDQ1802658.1 hypothetical protein [Chryseobacterium sp. CKR4-1]
MKKLWIGAVLGLFIMSSCAQNKEKREEFKDEHDKNAMRNTMGDSAVANSDTAQTNPSDSLKTKTDSTKAK